MPSATKSEAVGLTTRIAAMNFGNYDPNNGGNGQVVVTDVEGMRDSLVGTLLEARRKAQELRDKVFAPNDEKSAEATALSEIVAALG